MNNKQKVDYKRWKINYRLSVRPHYEFTQKFIQPS